MFNLIEGPAESKVGKIEGIALGIVTNNKDKEKLGRVKVKFPWLGESDESDWVRVATPMAGGDRGSFFLPEVGDEVIVAFDHGDVNYPYIIGSLWNNTDKPPSSNETGKNNIRMIRSRSGHEIIFDDNKEEGSEKLEVRTKAGHTILLDDSSGQEKIDIRDKTGKNSILIDSVQGSIDIHSNLKVSIKAKEIEIASEEKMTIKAEANLDIKGALIKIN